MLLQIGRQQKKKFLFKGKNNLEIDYHAKHQVLAPPKKKENGC